MTRWEVLSLCAKAVWAALQAVITFAELFKDGGGFFLSAVWLCSVAAADAALFFQSETAKPPKWYWRFCGGPTVLALACRLLDADASWFVFLLPVVPAFPFAPVFRQFLWPGRVRDIWCLSALILFGGLHLFYFKWLHQQREKRKHHGPLDL